jgi:integrase
MSILKSDSGKWKTDFRPLGRTGPRFRKTFSTKSEAKRYQTHIENKYLHKKEWIEHEDKIRLKDLITSWFNHHGKTLKDGSRRYTALLRTCESLGNPIAQKLRAKDYLTYRSKRLSDGLSSKTCNNELTYLSAVFNEMRRGQVISYSNPLEEIRPIKIEETELSYLSSEQITELLEEIDHHDAKLITKICLATGCRWGEAQSLKRRQVRDKHIHFTNTKSSKNRNIPISEELEQEIHNIKKEQLFDWSLSAFRRALVRTSIELPKGQSSHVLRHTFASHFMMNGGNILTLQRILGHSSLTMTMRYSHFAPEHLQDAVRLGPKY